MRVIAGTARSLPLKTLEGLDTRPTQDRIKETLFNMLQNDIPGAVFVDLFSGSGAIGIEALSRGAKKAYFVENNAKACDIIKENLLFTKFTEKSIIKKQDVYSAIAALEEKEADIIFMDPPYDKEYEKRALEGLQNAGYVTDDTLIIVEASLTTKFDYVEELGFMVTKEKKYKTNKHVFIRRVGGN